MVAGNVRQARATVTVDLAAVAANCRTLRSTVEPAELWAVVKADGYGHGAAVVGRAALDAGATRLCVASLEEAVALRREVEGAPVLVMGPLAPGEEADVAGLDVAVSSVEAFARLRRGARSDVGVHVKVDSGMGRWGMSADEALRIGEALAGGDGPLRLAGLMSHLATADTDNEFTSRQLDRFAAVSDRFPACPRHVANSAAAMWRPDARYDAVRCGVGVYGLHPAGGDPADQGIAPALRFESYVAQVKLLEPGQSAGYGRRFVAAQPTWIGLAPAGYADGVPRLLSGRADVIVRGRRRRIAATISMDQLTFVIGEECDVEPGDRVVMLGADGDEAVRAEEWARLSETINYEVVTDIAPRRRRVEHVVIGP